MRIWQRVVLIVAIALFTNLGGMHPAIADPTATSPNVPFSPAANSALWEKFERLQQDSQLQELVERDMERSIAIRTQIQEEVDRAFNHTTALLNVLLAVLTCLPVLAAIGIWFIRRSVLNQIVAETRKQLREEVEKQLESEVAAELKLQSEAFQKKIEALVKAECQSQLAAQQHQSIESIPMRYGTEKVDGSDSAALASFSEDGRQTGDQVANLLSNPLENQSGSQSALQSSNQNANDYVEIGRTLHTKGRYEEAIAAYDKALQLEPNHLKAWFNRGATLTKLRQLEAAIAAYDQVIQLKPDIPDAWFGKARGYALLGDTDAAIAHLQQAVQLNGDRIREALKIEPAFDAIRTDDRYSALI